MEIGTIMMIIGIMGIIAGMVLLFLLPGIFKKQRKKNDGRNRRGFIKKRRVKKIHTPYYIFYFVLLRLLDFTYPAEL